MRRTFFRQPRKARLMDRQFCLIPSAADETRKGSRRRFPKDFAQTCPRVKLTRVAPHEDGVIGLGGGGLRVGVGDGVAPPIHAQAQGVFALPGHQAVPASVAQHRTARSNPHSARPVIDVKHHLRARPGTNIGGGRAVPSMSYRARRPPSPPSPVL